MKGSCGNCDAFVRNDVLKPAAGEPRQGWCHGGLPKLVQLMQQGHSLAARGPTLVPVSIPNVWPPVTEDQWCRQWKEDVDDGKPEPA